MPNNDLMTSALTAQDWFAWAGQLAMLGWFVLVFMPRRFKALFFMAQYLIPLALGLLYTGIALSHFFTSEGGYGSLAQVRLLFSNDFMLLAGWVHYLAFDLFIAAWIAVKADEIHLSRLLQAPILVATFLFGPLGLVLFLLTKQLFLTLRLPTSKKWTNVLGGQRHV